MDESEDEKETQPPSISPAKRESPSPPPQSLRSPTEQVVDSLTKYIHMACAPYQFLLQGLPYKLNSAKKVSTALIDNPVIADMCDIEVLFRGPQPAGKCIVTARSAEAALAVTQIHGRKIGTRTITVEVAPMAQRRPVPKTSQAPRKPQSDQRPATRNPPCDLPQTPKMPVSRPRPAPAAPLPAQSVPLTPSDQKLPQPKPSLPAAPRRPVGNCWATGSPKIE